MRDLNLGKTECSKSCLPRRANHRHIVIVATVSPRRETGRGFFHLEFRIGRRPYVTALHPPPSPQAPLACRRPNPLISRRARTRRPRSSRQRPHAAPQGIGRSRPEMIAPHRSCRTIFLKPGRRDQHDGLSDIAGVGWPGHDHRLGRTVMSANVRNFTRRATLVRGAGNPDAQSHH